VLIIEMASFALRTAWLKLVICAFIRVTTVMPAASSFAPLMRLPEDKRSIAWFSDELVSLSDLAAEIDEIFVLITGMDWYSY
jgi:hypothetical protein